MTGHRIWLFCQGCGYRRGSITFVSWGRCMFLTVERNKVFHLALMISLFPTVAQHKVTALFNLDTESGSTVGLPGSSGNRNRWNRGRGAEWQDSVCMGVCLGFTISAFMYAVFPDPSVQSWRCACLRWWPQIHFVLSHDYINVRGDKTRQLNEDHLTLKNK